MSAILPSASLSPLVVRTTSRLEPSVCFPDAVPLPHDRGTSTSVRGVGRSGPLTPQMNTGDPIRSFACSVEGSTDTD